MIEPKPGNGTPKKMNLKVSPTIVSNEMTQIDNPASVMSRSGE